MTHLLCSSLIGRWRCYKFRGKTSAARAPVCAMLFAALAVCAYGGGARANPAIVDIMSRSGCAGTTQAASMLAVSKCSRIQKRRSAYPSLPSTVDRRVGSSALDEVIGNNVNLKFELSSPQLASLTLITLLASVRTSSGKNDILTPDTLIGIASTYDPIADGSGGLETASGEQYDEMAWTAAIRTDLRAWFNGIRYGKAYKPAYALLESGNKRVIVKINDVGPLAPGRIIDLNKRAMQYFDPTLQLGLLKDVRVTPLPGPDWTAGPLLGNPANVVDNFPSDGATVPIPRPPAPRSS